MNLISSHDVSLLLDLYKEGDRIGAPFEGKPALTSVDRNSVKFQMAAKNSIGTDESDTVDRWREYVAANHDSVTPLGWALYFTDHHGAYPYGNVLPDFFATVKFLDRRGELTYPALLKVSQDRNSFGNGCLPLVLPLTHYALCANQDPHALVREFTLMTHYNDIALRACGDLVTILLGEGVWGKGRAPADGGRARGGMDAMDTLTTALWCAEGEGKDDVIDRALYIGFDTDSVLALALMLWGLRKE